MMRFLPAVFIALTAAVSLAPAWAADTRPVEADFASFRAPAYPLVTHDPYFSIWSTSEAPTGEWSQHWTGKPHPLCGLVRIDGRAYRFFGPEPETAPPMPMVRGEVWPTRTVYQYQAGGVELTLTFLTPTLPHDLALLSRPATYLTWEARSLDGRPHTVQIYFDASAEIAVNTPDQLVEWLRLRLADADVLRIGSVEQPILARSGDDLRIDWGHLYLAVPDSPGGQTVIAEGRACRERFAGE
ncbi:MAG: DUF5127 domain-containing protein, partial [Planctomycetota bacterium]